MHVVEAPAAGPVAPAAPPQRAAGGPAPTARHAIREEIQALRALAGVLVVVYHYWPAAAPARARCRVGALLPLRAGGDARRVRRRRRVLRHLGLLDHRHAPARGDR